MSRLWHWRKIPEEEPAKWDQKGQRHFPPGSIGGKPPTFLTEDDIDQVADLMGYFQSEQRCDIVDILASIKATAGDCGIPRIKFNKRKMIRSLLVLEDTFAEASSWNTIAKELADGIGSRGIPVLWAIRGSAQPIQDRGWDDMAFGRF